jgi:phosphatidate cytidylyltransferase
MQSKQPVPAAEGGALRSNLAQRVIAALVLAPIALGAVFYGGWIWFALAAAIGAGLYLEWLSVIGSLGEKRIAIAGLVSLAVTAAIVAAGRIEWMPIAVGIGAILIAAMASTGKRAWSAAGLIYAAAALVAAVVVRGEGAFGLVAMLFVFAIVWATDILGYFAGRGIGGPKLWPRVSPKKTWAGALGGFAGSIAIGGLFAALGAGRAAPLVLLAGVLSIVSQAGDLFESALKRRFDVKDSSQLIPGHGGLLDRLDGFVAAVTVAALIGTWRAGSGEAARGLLQW